MTKKKGMFNYLDKEKNIFYMEQRLLNRLLAMFKYDGLPDTIPQIELEKILLNGFACIAKHDGNLYAFAGGLGGELDVYYRPTICTVVNPALNLSKDYEINKDCIIIKNDSHMAGMFPLVSKFAYFIYENEISQLIQMINSRASWLLSASDDNTRNSAKEFINQLWAGKLSIIADNSFLESLKAHVLTGARTQTLQDLIQENQYLHASFLNEIGLNANTLLKKERLLQGEVEQNGAGLYPIVDDMLNSRRDDLEKVNQMFGTNISVEFTSSWDYRVFGGANIENPIQVSQEELKEQEDNSNDSNTDNPNTGDSDIVGDAGGTDNVRSDGNTDGGNTNTDNDSVNAGDSEIVADSEAEEQEEIKESEDIEIK